MRKTVKAVALAWVFWSKTLTGLALAALALSPTSALAQRPSAYLVVPLYTGGGGGGGLPSVQVSNDPEFWAQQKQIAREQMDLTLREKAECKGKFWTASAIRDCETTALHMESYWLERYQSADREYQRQLRLVQSAK